MSWNEIFFDDFLNGTLDIPYENHNGLNTEPSSTSLIQSCSLGTATDIWNTTFLAPFAYQIFASYDPANNMMVGETRLTSFTRSSKDVCGGLFIHKDHLNHYRFFYNDYDKWVQIYKTVGGVSAGGAHAVVPNINVGPQRYRIYYNSTAITQVITVDSRNILAGHIAFYYSVNDGVTWTFLYDEAAGFVPTSFGIFSCNGWGVQASFSVNYDYLKIYQGNPITPIFFDDFNNGVLDISYENHNGTNSEPFSSLVQSGAVGTPMDIWNSTFLGPLAHQTFAAYDPTNYMMAGEIRLTSGVISDIYVSCGLIVYLNHSNHYRLFYSFENNVVNITRTVSGVTTQVAPIVVSSPNTTPHRYRAYYNSKSISQTITIDSRTILVGHIAFYCSANDGVSWTFLYDEAVGFTPISFGMSGTSWSGYPSFLLSFDYLKIYQSTDDISGPYTANIDPVDLSTGVVINATVGADILDSGSGVNESTVIIDVDGVAAWSSGTQQVGFVVTESVIASGYRYHVVPNVDFGYNHHGVLRFRAADNTGNSLDQTITFDTVVDISGPIITNKLPTSYSTGVATNAIISLDATDVFSGVNILAFNLDIAGIYDHAVINGIAQTGYSLITTPITNGYNFAISHASIPFPAGITKHISGTLADNIGNTVYFSWFFTTVNVSPVVNTIYFSDGYGLKKIEMADLSGESQSQATTLLSVDTVPSIGGNTISSIYGEYVDDYGYYIAFSCKSDIDDYGCYILKDEVPLNQFRDGYYVLEPRINNRGILYLINKDNNTIDVYYGAHFRSGSREPDFVYSISSTPALFDGDILCLHISNDSSLVLNNGTRLYVGTTLGLTRIDAYDEELKDGYSADSEIYGRSYTYGILGSGASFEVIGGTVAQVSAVAADEQNLMIFVVTNDGNSGGLTQITMEGNRKIVYMTKAGGFLPSNNIKDVFFKN